MDLCSIETECPNCSRMIVQEISEPYYYLYPSETYPVTFICHYEDCGWEWEKHLKIKVTIESVIPDAVGI